MQFKALSRQLAAKLENKGKGSSLPQRVFSEPLTLLIALDIHSPAGGQCSLLTQDNIKSLPI